MTESSIDKLKREAFAVSEKYRSNPMSFATRMAFASGVHSMAALMIACANAAEQLRDEQEEGSIPYIMLAGYADGLRTIAEAADDMIPVGYEP